jgi:hypothetical protein
MEFKKKATPSTIRNLCTRIEQLLAPDPSRRHYAYKLGVIVDVQEQAITWRAVHPGDVAGDCMDDTGWTMIPIAGPTSATGALSP